MPKQLAAMVAYCIGAGVGVGKPRSAAFRLTLGVFEGGDRPALPVMVYTAMAEFRILAFVTLPVLAKQPQAPAGVIVFGQQQRARQAEHIDLTGDRPTLLM